MGTTVCVVLGAAVVARAGDSGVLDLPALTDAAARHSHGLAASRHAIAAAEAKLSEAQISPFFQFRTTAGFAMVPGAEGTPGYRADSINELDREFGPALRATIEGAVPLWTFGKIQAGKDAARAGVRAAEHARDDALHEVIFDTRRAYYALQLALDTLQMISEGEPKLDKALTQFDTRLAENDPETDPMDRFRLATALAEVRARRSEATRVAESARAALEVLTGIAPIRVPDCPLATVEHTRRDPAWYRAQALRHRPELAMLGAASAARRADLDLNTAKYYPDLALTMELGAEYIPGRTMYEYYNPLLLGAGVVARWNLDFWGQSHRERNAEAKLLETEERAVQAREGVELEVSTEHAALVDARERENAWNQGRDEARRWFVSAAQGYEVGLVKPKELVDSLGAYFKARFAQLTAIHDQNVSLAKMERAVGVALVAREAWGQNCEPLPANP
jgi:outer membrane protein TolC